MTIRGKALSPKDWAEKATEFLYEARLLGVVIRPPDINISNLDFTINNNEILFGLGTIKDIGKTAANIIVRTRKTKPYKDVFDFIQRVNTAKVTTKIFRALAASGVFDRLGYNRQSLLTQIEDIYSYAKNNTELAERTLEITIREKENLLREQRLNELKDLLAIAKEKKKKKLPLIYEEERILGRDQRLKGYRELVKQITEQNQQIEAYLSQEDLAEYTEHLSLKKKPTLKPKELINKPEIQRSSRVYLDIKDILLEGESLGCYIGGHPARMAFPTTTKLSNVIEGSTLTVAGVILTIKEITDKNKQKMAFIKIGDESGIAELIIFARTYIKLPELTEGDIISVRGKIDTIEPMTKIIVYSVDIHRS